MFTRRFTLYVPIAKARLALATWRATSVPETRGGPKVMNGRSWVPSVIRRPTIMYRIAAAPTRARTNATTTTRMIRPWFVFGGGG